MCGTTLHGLLEADAFRARLLGWVAEHAGVAGSLPGTEAGFQAARLDRIDRIADALEASLEVPQILDLVRAGAPA
jgi:adenosylcobyric acid synthase